MNIFAKARANINLTPGERAILRLIQGMFISVGLAILPAAGEGILLIMNDLGKSGYQWWPSLLTLGISLGHTALAAINKYWTAHGDAPLGQAIENAGNGVLNSLGLNADKVTIPAPLVVAHPVAATATAPDGTATAVTQ